MNILKSALFGLVLVIGACILLFWAEGRAVKTARSLEEGKGLVAEVDAAKIDAGNDGKLVHITGDAVPQDVPGDLRLGVEAKGAVSLTRLVEMLQWKEISKEMERTASDGSKTKSTVYDYNTVWSSTPIESSKFKTAAAPNNPPMPLVGEDFTIDAAKVGAFRLAGDAVAALGKDTPLRLSDSGIAQAAAALGNGNPVWLVNNRYVFAADPEAPQVGDLRIGFARGDVSRVSAVGRQAGDKLQAYTTSNGREVFLIQAGNASAAEMFKDAIEGNVFLTWVIRAGGLLMMFLGFMLSFAPLTGTLGRLPLIGALIRGGASLVALVMTLALGSILIAMGWIFYRPLLALAIIAVGVGAAVVLSKFGKKDQVAAADRPGPPRLDLPPTAG